MCYRQKILSFLLLANATHTIANPNNEPTHEMSSYNFIKNLGAEELKVCQSLNDKRGLLETLAFFNSPSYQLFKLCQKNDSNENSLYQQAIQLIRQGADPHFTYNNLSLIRLASTNGLGKIVDLLLECGVMPTYDDVHAMSLKLEILATCQEDDMLSQDESYPGISFDHDKHSFLTIQANLQHALGSGHKKA